MNKHNQDGALNVLILPLIIATVLLLAAVGFSVVSYSGEQSAKTNLDGQIATAVTAAKQQEDAVKDKQNAEANKSPLKTYTGPATYGSITMQYPKTWSAYVDTTGNASGGVVDGYFYPDVVPSISDQNSRFALRVSVVNQSYTQVTQNLTSELSGLASPPTVNPYSLPKVPKVVGLKIDGQISDKITGTMILLPLRDSTLEISTQLPQFEPDFNASILPNFSFSP